MKNFKLAFLTAAAIGAISIGTASAMPLNGTPSAGEGNVQAVRIICDRYGRNCYNTNSQYRSSRRYNNNYYGYDDRYDRGYRHSERSVGFGPFGLWVR